MLEAPQLRWRAMAAADLSRVMHIEQLSHSHPWSEGNFRDSLNTPGFYMPMLLQDARMLGYLVAMAGFEEVHLLNVTVEPAARGQGLGRLLMQALQVWAQQQAAQHIWLEVRQSNTAAEALYRSCGYEFVSLRKNYYPLNAEQREHAIVMHKALPGAERLAGAD
ncbi:ribosomal protein S18-alanine N-acetyltransferase [Lampropedia aestuarii]|uniref:ribosomal protein S18-alanine N-acetyltransferase n=1 Tax=Lampropedia aestuarii TaxID=2562762 RepID=UPI002468648F|nr:ribosomal protein S18-alanine N-acetyltransferase [Lampropedia aestuarii]MDH5857496.1 ribosomal protein S18-alanine N-acetyltransferase [Lampropedia aestuarii]